MPLALTEFYFFWTVMARYHILHLHFMQGISRTGWEWSVLKLLGRRIVVYYSGCEIRDRDLNAELHPGMNICEECDYASELCSGKISRRRRKLSARYADLELITTPDMRDFVPQGIHFPFFCPPDDIIPPRTRPYWPENKVFRVVHVTNHPGIEGTAAIAAACEMVRAQGHAVEFRHLLRTPYGQVLQEMADADLSIGKMKMGYYANAQIEALSCGTPCISHVRAGLITDALRASPLILTNLADLESEIGRLVKNPGLLAVYRAQARSGIGALHDNRTLSRRLLRMYQLLAQGRSHAEIASIVPDGLVDPAESGDYTRE
jgi:hypothetical protein